jgi:hypothetical protein
MELLERVFQEGIQRSGVNVDYAPGTQKKYQDFCQRMIADNPNAKESELFHNADIFARQLLGDAKITIPFVRI